MDGGEGKEGEEMGVMEVRGEEERRGEGGTLALCDEFPGSVEAAPSHFD